MIVLLNYHDLIVTLVNRPTLLYSSVHCTSLLHIYARLIIDVELADNRCCLNYHMQTRLANGIFTNNTTDKLKVGSRGGARITVERVTIIFLLPLVRNAKRHTHAEHYRKVLHGNNDHW